MAHLIKFINILVPDNAKRFCEDVLKENHTKDSLNVSDVLNTMDVGRTE